MGLFKLLFPREAAQLSLQGRRLAELMDRAGLDDAQNPDLAEVVEELRAGRDIKAAQLYSTHMGVGVGESHLAVSEMKARLSL